MEIFIYKILVASVSLVANPVKIINPACLSHPIIKILHAKCAPIFNFAKAAFLKGNALISSFIKQVVSISALIILQVSCLKIETPVIISYKLIRNKPCLSATMNNF